MRLSPFTSRCLTRIGPPVRDRKQTETVMPNIMLGPMRVDGAYEGEQLTRRMGIEIVTCEPGLVVGTMPISGNRQPVGILHGGANAVLAETLGSQIGRAHV